MHGVVELAGLMLVDWRTSAVFIPVAAVFVTMPGADFMYVGANAELGAVDGS